MAELALLVALLSAATSCSVKQAAPDIPLTFDGSSQDLKATEVVPTLDTPIPKGKNAIWCASFQSAWKALEALAGEAIRLSEMPKKAGQLNTTPDPRPHIPPASLYPAGGWNQKGITNQIWRDLQQRFPSKPAPAFPGMTPDSFVAYAYLEANVRFPVPYDQNPQPLVFAEMDIAQQDIRFCLNRSGATLRSEAKTEKSAIPTNFFFERPFLVYLKKRGAPIPYFAMWVDNAELLRRWDSAGKPGMN